MRHLLAALLTLTLAGCASPRLVALKYFHPAKDDQGAQTCLTHGDKDHDGTLSRAEYVGLGLIVLDGLARSLEQRVVLEEARNRRQPDPERLAKVRKDVARELEETRKRSQERTERLAAEFPGYDTNFDGKLDAGELAALCHDQATGPTPP